MAFDDRASGGQELPPGHRLTSGGTKDLATYFTSFTPGIVQLPSMIDGAFSRGQ